MKGVRGKEEKLEKVREIIVFFEGLWYNRNCGIDLFCFVIGVCYGWIDFVYGDYNKEGDRKKGLIMRVVFNKLIVLEVDSD